MLVRRLLGRELIAPRRDEFHAPTRSSLETRKREDGNMTPRLVVDISMSLDGFIAGPNQTLEQPLGAGGERLHEWVTRLASWREHHGLSGGETGADDDVVAESTQSTGAVVMGRRMFSGGEGPWEDDPNADGWWGDDPPFHVPVFVLTHHARETVTKQGGTTYTFVTDGIEAALEQARAAAGDKDVLVAGGAEIVQQYLKAGLLDELQIHLVPLLLGGGVRLFDRLGPGLIELEVARVIESPAVTHLRLRSSPPNS
jgi:dihydrofolate reductase